MLKIILPPLCLALLGCGGKSGKIQDGDENKSQDQSSSILNPDSGTGNPSPETPRGDTSKDDEPNSDTEAMLILVNKVRADQGLQPLIVSEELSYSATVWSQKQLVRKRISHDGFPQQRYEDIAMKFPEFSKFIRAENVVVGYPNSSDPEGIAQYFLDLWLASPGHRRNILGSYQGIGYGIAIDQNGQTYGTQIFY